MPPHRSLAADEVDFSGKHVGIIGTGSSGVQAIPVIARSAARLTVFQRTPQYAIPAGNRPLDPDFVRFKIRQIVRDPAVAEKLMPDYPLGTKRQILDSGYYDTFNRDNVTLVDLREDPIEAITPDGVRTRGGEHPLDMLILATGYDAITGALQGLNRRGRGGVTLKEAWAGRFSTYLGMAIRGFPNLFLIHGPQTPSVLFNMPLEAEWIRDCIRYLREQGLGAIEPAPGVDEAWGREVAEVASRTLFPLTESWYTGASIPGKHRQFAVRLGGQRYFQRLSEVAANGYEGFLVEPERAAVASPRG